MPGDSGPGAGADQDRLRHLAARAGTRPGPAQPQLTNASAVVLQYHQDITDHDRHAARALGGSNIAAQNGQTYDSWVSDLGRRDRLAHLSATQLDGSVRTYDGTYTVANGVIASAHITQTS